MKPSFKLPLLDTKIFVSFAGNAHFAREDAEKCLDMAMEDASDSAGFAIATCEACFIWLGPKCKRQHVFHECYHATHGILKEIDANGADEELNARINDFINERVLTLWEAHKGK